jgi:hypothetical protein
VSSGGFSSYEWLSESTWPLSRCEHDLNLPLSGKIPHTLKPRSFQRRSAIAIIFEDPFGVSRVQLPSLVRFGRSRHLP